MTASVHDEAFSRAFDKVEAALRAYCNRALNHRDEAKDVFQRACLVLWKKRRQWDIGRPFRPWAMRVARFEILAHARDCARERLVFDDAMLEAARSGEFVKIGDRSDEVEALEASLAVLKPEQQQALRDRYVFGLNLREIARKQGRKLSAVKMMLSRLRQAVGAAVRRRLGMAD